MLRTKKGFENFTYEFLSFIAFKKDRMNFDNLDYRVSFCNIPLVSIGLLPIKRVGGQTFMERKYDRERYEVISVKHGSNYQCQDKRV